MVFAVAVVKVPRVSVSIGSLNIAAMIRGWQCLVIRCWHSASKLAQKMHRQDALGIIGLAGSIAASPGCNSEVDEDRFCHLEEDQNIRKRSLG